MLRDNNYNLIISEPPSRILSTEILHKWAAGKSIFISSTINDMRDERKAICEAVQKVGANPVMWETIAPVDEEPNQAYLKGVRSSNIYLLILKTRYGIKLQSGYSPTNEEYEEARRLDLPVRVWIKAGIDAKEREGHLNRWIIELQNFHSTGEYVNENDLGQQVERVLNQMAVEEVRQWIKLGQAVFPTDSIREIMNRGKKKITINATTDNRNTQRYFESLDFDYRSYPLTYKGRTVQVKPMNLDASTTQEGYHILLTMEVEQEYQANSIVQMNLSTNGKSYTGDQVAQHLVEEAISRSGRLEKGFLFASSVPELMLDRINDLNLSETTKCKVLELLIAEGLTQSGLVRTANTQVSRRGSDLIAKVELECWRQWQDPLIRCIEIPVKY
ncbi:DUF4062 domain-containing protein [Syntrophomonas wolfei]|mgnify:CR=1 FL=1|uniref:DUF4062 domain-containing protein n=1 Tax=Syntrophomonas wolfei subsp. wolfei (strain DSM 2245B / Goettingen) TaxID=335541 RepID=Q0AVF3_SYNWW|nr:DUF4062 domain-containing protein [Syntrophomonas wolfei]ABI69301.1 hypothetical protein Swol_2006 [Syntrophomonas wolfei subsp. wolfei str. Goettingen G311]